MKTNKWTAVGTSITNGNHNGGVSYVQKCDAAYAPIGTIANISVPSSSCDDSGQGAAADGGFDGAKQVNILSVEFGANDGLTKTAAQFVADLKTFCLARRSAGFKIIVCTMLPCGSYDSAAFRTSSRSLIFADPSFYDYVVDYGDPATTMGAEAAKNDASLYSDTVHPTDFGYGLLEPAMTAGLRFFIEEPSPSPSASGSPSHSASASTSGSPSASASGSASASESTSISPSGSPSASASHSPSRTASASASGSPSRSESGSRSASESGSRSASASGSVSASPSASGSLPGPVALPDVDVIC
jgi:hypothetical protein